MYLYVLGVKILLQIEAAVTRNKVPKQRGAYFVYVTLLWVLMTKLMLPIFAKDCPMILRIYYIRSRLESIALNS